jgi:phage terminase large subunit-like protein
VSSELPDYLAVLPPWQRDRPGFHFDEQAANKAVEFIEELCHHTKGEYAGTPLILEPWQRAIVRALFGWKRADGTRRFRRAYIEVPKKNGKSTLGAALGLYLTSGDEEDGAEVYSAAADRQQAGIIFDQASDMVEVEPELSSRFGVYVRHLTFPERRSVYRVLSSDAPSKHGFNIHGTLFDELHTQPNRELWDTLKGGGASRRQPLLIAFTTAGYDRSSICWEQHEYAEKVLAGLVEDDYFFAAIYAAGPDDDWTDPATWRKANPNLGVSVKEDFLREECNAAKESPAAQNTFRRLHLNQWTEQATRWIDIAVWDENAGEVDAVELLGRPCYAGLDLASTMDVAALVLLFPPIEELERLYRVLPFFWVPEETAALRSRRDRVQYDTWIRSGAMLATEGNVTDYGVIRQTIRELAEQYELRELAIDRWNSTQLQTELGEDGITVVPFGQGFASMAAPTKELERLTLERRLAHGGHPVLRWMASNVAVKTDPAGNLKPDKSRSTEKIDGIVALVMALGRATLTTNTQSVYETEGMMIL